MKRTICDNCGQVNPPTTRPDSRVTACCPEQSGLYDLPKEFWPTDATELTPRDYEDEARWGSNGKTITVHLQFPIAVEWQSLWTWRKTPRFTKRNY
jgi:hypothetical protein